MDINCNYKCIFLRNVDNANHGTRNPEANYLACIHITANITCILKFILSLVNQCVVVVDGDDAHRSADLVGYFLLGRAQSNDCLYGGPGWIRTNVSRRKEIYSLPPLTTWVPTHIGAPSGIRTQGLLIKSQLLYQLS